jgi:hypothetical protein
MQWSRPDYVRADVAARMNTEVVMNGREVRPPKLLKLSSLLLRGRVRLGMNLTMRLVGKRVSALQRQF